MEFKTTQSVILFIYYFFSQWTLHEERVKFPTEKTIMSKVKLLACKPAMEMTFTNLKTQDTKLRAICCENSDLPFGQ